MKRDRELRMDMLGRIVGPNHAELARSASDFSLLQEFGLVCHCAGGLRLWIHFFEFARLPGAVERRTFVSVDEEVAEPALTGDRLDPLAFVTGGCGWAEVVVGRTVRLRSIRLLLTRQS